MPDCLIGLEVLLQNVNDDDDGHNCFNPHSEVSNIDFINVRALAINWREGDVRQTMLNMKSILGIVLLAFTVSSFCGCYKPPNPPKSRFEFIRNFDKLGSDPAALFQSKDGFLYGAFKQGGQRWEGAVFKMLPDGTDFEILHHFTGYQSGQDGSWIIGLLEGNDGYLYGVSQGGGIPDSFLRETGGGTVFRVAKDGSGYAVLHRFTGGAEGIEPWGGLAQDSHGKLFGTTLNGGKHDAGTIFKLNKDGSGYTILHHFAGGDDDGATPMADLIMGRDRLLYGTTAGGGDSGPRNGTVFRMNTDGTGFKLLHHFPSGKDDGRTPRTLIEAPDGTLYGTTQMGGEQDGGTVFKMNKDGSGYHVLHRFNADTDGMGPNGLALRADGTLFGTSEHRGPHGHGTLFSLNIKGTGFAVLHPFGADQNEGLNPAVKLLLTSDGTLLGMTMRSQPESNSATFFKVTFRDQE